MFLKEELAVTIMMDTRTTKAVEFRGKCKINQHDPILTKEQSIGSKIVKAFPSEKPFALNEKIDFYFQRHKLAIEVDELGHLDRNEEDEIKRQKKLEEHLKCTFFRINPDKVNFVIFLELGKIESYISESNKKITEESTKNSLIDDLSKRLLELTYEKHNSIKLKCVKLIVKKNTTNNIKMSDKKHVKKKISYCLKCKKQTRNKDNHKALMLVKLVMLEHQFL